VAYQRLELTVQDSAALEETEEQALSMASRQRADELMDSKRRIILHVHTARRAFKEASIDIIRLVEVTSFTVTENDNERKRAERVRVKDDAAAAAGGGGVAAGSSELSIDNLPSRSASKMSTMKVADSSDESDQDDEAMRGASDDTPQVMEVITPQVSASATTAPIKSKLKKNTSGRSLLGHDDKILEAVASLSEHQRVADATEAQAEAGGVNLNINVSSDDAQAAPVPEEAKLQNNRMLAVKHSHGPSAAGGNGRAVSFRARLTSPFGGAPRRLSKPEIPSTCLTASDGADQGTGGQDASDDDPNESKHDEHEPLAEQLDDRQVDSPVSQQQQSPSDDAALQPLTKPRSPRMQAAAGFSKVRGRAGSNPDVELDVVSLHSVDTQATARSLAARAAKVEQANRRQSQDVDAMSVGSDKRSQASGNSSTASQYVSTLDHIRETVLSSDRKLEPSMWWLRIALLALCMVTLVMCAVGFGMMNKAVDQVRSANVLIADSSELRNGLLTMKRSVQSVVLVAEGKLQPRWETIDRANLKIFAHQTSALHEKIYKASGVSGADKSAIGRMYSEMTIPIEYMVAGSSYIGLDSLWTGLNAFVSNALLFAEHPLSEITMDIDHVFMIRYSSNVDSALYQALDSLPDLFRQRANDTTNSVLGLQLALMSIALSLLCCIVLFVFPPAITGVIRARDSVFKLMMEVPIANVKECQQQLTEQLDHLGVGLTQRALTQQRDSNQGKCDRDSSYAQCCDRTIIHLAFDLIRFAYDDWLQPEMATLKATMKRPTIRTKPHCSEVPVLGWQDPRSDPRLLL